MPADLVNPLPDTDSVKTGDTVCIRFRGKTCQGKVAMVGPVGDVKQKEEEFLEGTYTPDFMAVPEPETPLQPSQPKKAKRTKSDNGKTTMNKKNPTHQRKSSQSQKVSNAEHRHLVGIHTCILR